MTNLSNNRLSMKAITASVLLASAISGNAHGADVMFHAYDSRGNDTKTCMATTNSGYALLPCDKSDSTQTYSFDTGGLGGPIAQGNACATVPSQLPDPWVNGTWIANRKCDSSDYTSKNWRWTNGDQIIATDSPNQAKCLTADGVKYNPPRIILLDCGDKSKLTSWSVLVN